MGDHSETIEIDFDPAVVSYEDLLSIFWQSHDAARPSFSRQYRSAVFYHSEAQREAAERIKAGIEKRERTRLDTGIEPFGNFTLAEDYHQKYYLRHNAVLMRELEQRYPNLERFVGSTVVCRLNALAGGNKLPETDFAAYGLSPESTAYVEVASKQARKVIRCGG